MRNAIHAVVMRGGARTGVFLRADVLPAEPAGRDALLLRLIDSPNLYGLLGDAPDGGAPAAVSVALVSPSLRADCDVSCYFGRVNMRSRRIDYSGYCTDLAAAVGHYAVAEGLFPPVEDSGTVRVWQENRRERLLVHLPKAGEAPAWAGRDGSTGGPRDGRGIDIDFLGRDPAAPCLSSEQSAELLILADGTRLRVSLVISGNPTVFVRADDLGLTATEQPNQFPVAILELLEEIRCAACVRMGLADSPQAAHRQHPDTPEVAMVGPPRGMQDGRGEFHPATAMDVCARIVTNGRPHHGFSTAGAVALAIAARVPGTVVSEAARPGTRPLTLGHAGGLMAVDAEVRLQEAVWVADRARITSTASRLAVSTIPVID